MGEMGVGNPRAGEEDPHLARQLRGPRDGGGGLRRGRAPPQGAQGGAQFPRAGAELPSADQLQSRGRAVRVGAGGIAYKKHSVGGRFGEVAVQGGYELGSDSGWVVSE